MDFILGIFTGIGLALFAGYYLNEKRRKDKEAYLNRKEHPPGTVGIYIDGKFIEAFKPTEFPAKRVTTDIEQQLNEAIAREDFKEAARLRDLINKK